MKVTIIKEEAGVYNSINECVFAKALKRSFPDSASSARAWGCMRDGERYTFVDSAMGEKIRLAYDDEGKKLKDFEPFTVELRPVENNDILFSMRSICTGKI
jgi:hypothetical protein